MMTMSMAIEGGYREGAGQEEDGGRGQGGRGGDEDDGLDHEEGEKRLRVNKHRSGYCKNWMVLIKCQRKIKITRK